MRPLAVAAAIPLLILGMAAPAVAAKSCLEWGPAELTGIVVEGIYPGPPEFSSVAGGDASLSAVLLHLPQPICITGDDPMAEGPIKATELVQLACDPDTLPRGETVTLSGDLFARHTGYHVTPALFDCAE